MTFIRRPFLGQFIVGCGLIAFLPLTGFAAEPPVAHWKLDEASGNATDSAGSNTLTETSGTIDSTTGKISNARDFEVGDTEYFTISDNASLSTGDIDYTFTAWVKAESFPSFPAVVSKSNSASQQEYELFYNTTNSRFTFTVSGNGSAPTAVAANSLGAASTATWYFIVVWHDATANTINIQVNNGTADSAAHTTGSFDSTSPFAIGARSSNGSIPWDGLIDEVSFWKRVLTASEKTALYNSGNGLAYPWTPLVQTLSPADGATAVAVNTNLAITFDQTTRAGTGTLAMKRTSDDITVETITLSGSQLSGNGTTELTLNPAVTLSGSTSYYITWTANAFKNDFGNHVAAQTSTTYWNFTTADTTAPTINLLSPLHDATGVSPSTNLSITFDETSRAGTGTLSIKRLSDDVAVETITVSGSQLAGNGTIQLTLNPAVTLSGSTSYYVTWTANTFKDTSSNYVAAQSSPSYWNFTTTDVTAPTIFSLSPTDGATDVAVDTNFVLTFDEAVQGGTGSVLIKKGSDNSTIETIAADGGLVTGSGSTIITVNPSVTLTEGTTYYIQFQPTAFRDPSGNYFAGISNATTWNFETVAAASSSSSSSSSSQSGGGGRGSPAVMAKRIANARDHIIALYRNKLQASEVAQGASSSHSSSLSARRSPRPQREVARKPTPTLATVEGIGARRGVLVATVDHAEVLYRDVPTDAWFAPFVALVIEEQIAEGYRDEEGKPTGEFGVGNSIMAAEVLKMAFEAAGTSVDGLPPPRNISAKGTWAEAYVSAAEARGILPPDQDVHAEATRGEVIELLLRILGIPIANQPPLFRDVPIGHPHAAAIATAAFFGLVQGDTAADGTSLGTFRPDNPINRAEVAKLIALAREVLK